MMGRPTRPGTMLDTILVIPCYNEAERLDGAAIDAFLEKAPYAELLFVDDGSTDDTAGVVARLAVAHPGRIETLRLEPNRGKAEAVRQGLLAAAKKPVASIGFWDADFSTPLTEVHAFRACLMDRPEIEMVFGARVNLLGRDVRRKLIRHYVGRTFATLAAFVLGLGIYDTQCGAKLFRNTPDIVGLFAEPFISRWIFDVELIARLIRARGRTGERAAADVICECPLHIWHEKRGSKLRLWDFIRMHFDLLRIVWHYRKRGGR